MSGQVIRPRFGKPAAPVAPRVLLTSRAFDGARFCFGEWRVIPAFWITTGHAPANDE